MEWVSDRSVGRLSDWVFGMRTLIDGVTTEGQRLSFRYTELRRGKSLHGLTSFGVCTVLVKCLGLWSDFFFFLLFFLMFHYQGDSGHLTWARLQQSQMQRKPFLPVCAFFPLVSRLPVFGIFNVCTDVDACNYTQGMYEHRKRVSSES